MLKFEEIYIWPFFDATSVNPAEMVQITLSIQRT